MCVTPLHVTPLHAGYALASWGALNAPGAAWQVSVNSGDYGGSVGGGCRQWCAGRGGPLPCLINRVLDLGFEAQRERGLHKPGLHLTVP
jgi:hypothetical protein